MHPHAVPPFTIDESRALTARVIDEVRSVYVGHDHVPELLLVALLAGGHALLEGVPGVAKTTLVKAFAATLGLTFRRIQFTPDLLPADITGTYVLNPRDGSFQLREGPLFAHVVLGDEINRAPAKTQSALLEAMQESQVTIEGETRMLPLPFLVLATQNPIEQVGTYPLPEAQIDRFLIRLVLGYPSADEERQILSRFLAPTAIPQTVLAPEHVLRLRATAARIHVSPEVIDYVVRLAAASRKRSDIALGISPRASLAMLHAARAIALLRGRTYVLPDDIRLLAPQVFGHRIMLTSDAQLEGISCEQVLHQLINQVSPLRPD